MRTRQHVTSRRVFLRQMSQTMSVAPLVMSTIPSVSVYPPRPRHRSPDSLAEDESYWRPIQDAYHVDRALLNFNNGGVSPSPWKVQQAFRRMTEFANQNPAYNLWRIQEPQKENVRRDLAALFASDPEEIGICRNATEALETITFGLDLEPGTEILSTNQDYPRMVHAWNQRAKRDGIHFRQISLPTPAESHEQIVEAFRAAITPKTRLMHFCQVINITGQILPVRELCELARDHGIYSLVDGAHGFAHLDQTADDLGCDFYGTSLHKWLSAPFGTGMLYVRKELIGKLWPLFADEHPRRADIRKFEQIGTHPCPLFLSIAEAVHFHNSIGTDVKQARLRHLTQSWARPLAAANNVRLHTNLDPSHSCGIAVVEIEGIKPEDLARHLLDVYRIVVTPITHEEFQGIRITPHVYTSPTELKRLKEALSQVVERGVPNNSGNQK